MKLIRVLTVASLIHGVGWSSLASQDISGQRAVVRGLAFDGNSAIDDFTLGRSIATSNSSFFARSPLVRWLGFGEKRRFDETEFRRDVLRLALLYRQSGYLDATVDTIVRRRGQNISIRFLISEGEPVRVTAIDVIGSDSIVARSTLLSRMSIGVGDPFDRFLLKVSADSVTRYMQDHGYPQAAVFTNFDINLLSRTAAAWLDVVPGSRSVIGEITVQGADKVSEANVRRILAVRPGDLFRLQDLYDSQRALYRLNVYNFVDVSASESERRDSIIPIVVQLSEGRFRRARLGVGYGTVDCFRTLTSLTFNNFLGGARSLELAARLSKIGTGSPFNGGLENNVCSGLSDEQAQERLDLNYNVSATLRFPFLFTRNTTALVSVSGERRSEFQAFVREAVGTNLAITHRVAPNLPITFSYGLSYGSTEAEPAIFCEFFQLCRGSDTEIFTTRLVRSTVGLSLVYDRSNSPLNPTRGVAISAEARHASSLIGSDSLVQFSKGVVEIVSYHSLSRRTVFAWRLRLGSIVSPGPSLSGQDIRFIPPEERFYAGGPNSVRGFGQNELGPLVRVVDALTADTTISPTGGNTILLGSAELRLPIPGVSDRLKVGIFVDAGQVFERGSELFEVEGLKITPGIGLRLSTPIGPVRLDVAYNPHDPGPGPLYREVGDDLLLDPQEFTPRAPDGFFERLQLNFAVGQPF